MTSSMEAAELPTIFRCPISFEIMENPVTISTGITYDRQSIEKWLFTYKRAICPATMQPLHNFDLIPNHTLKNLILSWRNQSHHTQTKAFLSSSLSSKHLELASILSAMESSPFKVSSLRKLRSFATDNPLVFLYSNGVEALCRILTQSNTDCGDDFTPFRACEEALGVLKNLPFDNHDASIGLLSNPEIVKPMLTILQRGGAEARLDAITILQRLSKVNPSITNQFHQDIDVFKSLLDLLSDEVSTKLSSSSLDLLLQSVYNSKANRLKAIEAGAVCVLIELLPDEAGRQRREKTLLLLKRLCECAEGRSAFVDHRMGIAAVASKIEKEHDLGTKLGVKVLWLVCTFSQRKEVVEGMMGCGAVRKLFGLIHVDGHSSTKEKALMMVRMHGHAWRQYPCFPVELRAVRY
ncbi:E3 ubiquitin-protein ligase PUB23-like [Phalaenopsis equestris]|uniref:E3 ubiquitin-protein ligase PUB23-like n=1 Tax=Phalaenopsis equestris TaxID=78828 RepID=UPI0009E52C2E|nr:E3 ubiquitin-protein ligase PUB23-like [Phalaenopsis equestris]